LSTELSIRDLITPDLRRALDKLQDKKPMLKLAAEAVIGISEQSFTNPSMRLTTWPGLAESTIKRKGHDKPLQMEGALMGSLMANAPQSNQIEFGSSEKYANSQNFGYKQIPARPFIPISESATLLAAADAVKEVVEDYLKRALP